MTNLVKMSSLSKSLYQLSVLCIFLADLGKLVYLSESQQECTSNIQLFQYYYAVVCQYQWDCTAPDHNGQRYIPSERNRNAQNVPSVGGALYIFRASNLAASCYGPVTAIEYCYRYSTTAGSGQATFNWTVLILEDTGSNFVIDSIYDITSRLPISSENCTNDGQLRRTCCDRTDIEGFDLSIPNFAFGVTELAQGNTHEVTLLGFSDALPQYSVNAILFARADVILSIGSTISNRPTMQSGIRMLWFVSGKHQYSNTTDHDIVYPTL